MSGPPHPVVRIALRLNGPPKYKKTYLNALVWPEALLFIRTGFRSEFLGKRCFLNLCLESFGQLLDCFSGRHLVSSSHPSVSRPSAVGLNFGEFSFFLFFFFSSFLLFLWGFVFVALWACPVGLLLMVRAPLQRTVVLDVSPFPATASRVDIAKCINAKFTGTFDVQSVQFVPGGKAQVPFESPTAKQSVEGLEILNFGGIKCVLIYHYSFECSSTVLKNVLSAYGEVQEVRCQHYPDLSSVSTGMRIVKIVRNNASPGPWILAARYARSGTVASPSSVTSVEKATSPRCALFGGNVVDVLSLVMWPGTARILPRRGILLALVVLRLRSPSPLPRTRPRLMAPVPLGRLTQPQRKLLTPLPPSTSLFLPFPFSPSPSSPSPCC